MIPNGRRWAPLDTPEHLLDALTVAAALFTGYIVLGGIWTNQIAILTDTHPVVPLVVLGIVILLIGGLEGLQISVSNLQKKDLTELSEEYSRAIALHERFKNNDGVMKRFFGGRQFLIVALVFIASRLTTFPEMSSFPFTDVSFPTAISSWFEFLFLDLGLAGALFVLWLGNLTAQFVATDHPVEFLELRAMGILFSLCLWIDTMRLPRPATWLSRYFDRRIARSSGRRDKPARAPQSKLLPVSPEERWRRELESESGFVLTKTAHEWVLHADRIELAYDATYLIGRDGIDTLVDDRFLVPKYHRLGAQNSFRWNAVVCENDEAVPRDPDTPAVWARSRSDGYATGSGTVDERAISHDIAFEKTTRTVYRGEIPFTNYVLRFSNRNGPFRPGTKIRVEVEAELAATPTEFASGLLLVDHPCAKLELRIEYADTFDVINRPRLFVYNPVHGTVPGSEDCTSDLLDVRHDIDGTDVSTYTEEFPRTRSHYEIRWDVRSQ